MNTDRLRQSLRDEGAGGSDLVAAGKEEGAAEHVGHGTTASVHAPRRRGQSSTPFGTGSSSSVFRSARLPR
jgi:hypothetical protein